MTIEVVLFGGRIALVDECDEPKIRGYRWQLMPGGGRTIYAGATAFRNGRRTTIRMHRVILEVPPGLVVDHIDGDGLNNRRVNLRIVPQQLNALNRHRNQPNKHGFHGVVFVGNGSRFYGRVTAYGKQFYTRRCATPNEAAAERDKLILALHPGELVFLNFPAAA